MSAGPETAGLQRAAEICDQFESENFAVSLDFQKSSVSNPDFRVLGGDGSWSLSFANHAHIHCCKAHAAREIAAFIRRMIDEGSEH